MLKESALEGIEAMTVIELPDDQAAALTAKAAAQGLSLEDWFRNLARDESATASEAPDKPLQTAANIILKRMRNVPAGIMAAMPKDGATQHDHYIYGLPKKEA
jgi:plasmid stability protein